MWEFAAGSRATLLIFLNFLLFKPNQYSRHATLLLANIRAAPRLTLRSETPGAT